MALKILGFATIVLLGGFTAALVVILSLKFGWVAALPQDEYLKDFELFYFGGSGMVWIAASLLGLGSFSLRGAARIIALLLPLVAPLVYSVFVLIYFTSL